MPTQLGKHFWPQFSFVQGLRLDYLSPTIYLTDILILLVIIFSLKKIISFFKKQNVKSIFIIFLFFFSLLIGVSASKNPQAGFYGIIKLIEYLLLGIFILTSFKNLSKKYLLYIFAFGILFESVLSFLQIINKGSLNNIFYFLGERFFTAQTPGIANASINGQLFLRPYATMPHPNVLAGYLIIAMIFLHTFKKYCGKKFFLLIITVGTICLVLTLSRIATLMWFFYLIILFGFSIFEKYKKKVWGEVTNIYLLIALLLFSFVVFMFSNSFIIQRFTKTSFLEESVVQRTMLLKRSVQMFYQSPVFGVGINNFYNNLIPENEKNLFIQPVHNIYLLIASEAGIIGLMYFSYLIFKIFPVLNFGATKNKELLLVVFPIIFLGIFDHYFLTTQQGQIITTLVFSSALSVKIKT